MDSQYTYEWFIHQFESTKTIAKDFILSVDEHQFHQAPAEGRWSIAECYSHLISYGDLYFDNMKAAITENAVSTASLQEPFPPRWLPKKLVAFFKPPYKIKLKTIKPMKPGDTTQANRMDILDEYLMLQNKLLILLEEAHHQNVHLGKTYVTHPVFSVITMTLAECFLLLDAHQQRHQWQAEQTLKALKKHAFSSEE
jgi:hypothetical protein